MNKTDPFVEMGFEEISSAPRQLRPVKAFSTEAVKGFGGAYGDILDLLHAQLSAEEAFLPGELARRQAEQQLPEHLQPFLTEDDILPSYARLPSSSDVQNLLNRLQIETPPLQEEEKIAGRFGRLLGGGLAFGASPATAGRMALTGGIAGQTAEELGGGPLAQALSELGATVGTELMRSFRNLSPAQEARLESGLSKPRALSKEKIKTARITPERQQSTIKKLNEEAAKLGEEIVEKRLPITKKIKEGFDFESQFEKRFGEVQKLAQKADPLISSRPIKSFFKNTIEKYRGIPELHTDAKQIVKEIRSFGQKPPQTLNELLKTYRSNNQKLKNIYEKSRLEGSRKEYADFIADYNRNISRAIEEALPQDSSWLKMFKEANQDYKNYQDALKVQSRLRPLLKGEATPDKIAKIASDPKMQRQLELYMGKEGASEIRQLSSDLKEAQQAIKRIPTKELSAWNQIFPLYLLLPKKILAPLGIVKAISLGKYGYGAFLSSPEKIRDYRAMITAINNNNKINFINAARKFKNELGIEEKIDWEEMGFEEEKLNNS